MKTFLLRYGFVILLGLAILFIVIRISPLWTPITNWFNNETVKFKQSELYQKMQSTDSIEVIQNVEKNGEFTVVINSDESHEWTLYYKYKDSSGFWSDYLEVYEEVSVGEKEHRVTFDIPRTEAGVTLKFKAVRINSMTGKEIELEGEEYKVV